LRKALTSAAVAVAIVALALAFGLQAGFFDGH
jgi:hypothetical protein